MKYKLVYEYHHDKFENEVNRLLNDGWELSGTHQTVSDQDGYTFMSQSMIYDESLDVPMQMA